MWSSRLPGCRKMYCSIFHSFFKISRGAGSQFTFFGSFFTSFLMVSVYKNEKKMDQKWEPWAPLMSIFEKWMFFSRFSPHFWLHFSSHFSEKWNKKWDQKWIKNENCEHPYYLWQIFFSLYIFIFQYVWWCWRLLYFLLAVRLMVFPGSSFFENNITGLGGEAGLPGIHIPWWANMRNKPKLILGYDSILHQNSWLISFTSYGAQNLVITTFVQWPNWLQKFFEIYITNFDQNKSLKWHM